MARINLLTGEFQGALGGMVGVKWKRQNIVKSKITRSTSNTKIQNGHRQTYSQLVKYWNTCGQQFYENFKNEYKEKWTKFNVFLKSNKWCLSENTAALDDVKMFSLKKDVFHSVEIEVFTPSTPVLELVTPAMTSNTEPAPYSASQTAAGLNEAGQSAEAWHLASGLPPSADINGLDSYLTPAGERTSWAQLVIPEQTYIAKATIITSGDTRRKVSGTGWQLAAGAYESLIAPVSNRLDIPTTYNYGDEFEFTLNAPEYYRFFRLNKASGDRLLQWGMSKLNIYRSVSKAVLKITANMDKEKNNSKWKNAVLMIVNPDGEALQVAVVSTEELADGYYSNVTPVTDTNYYIFIAPIDEKDFVGNSITSVYTDPLLKEIGGKSK